jgi:hypothetical protein
MEEELRQLRARLAESERVAASAVTRLAESERVAASAVTRLAESERITAPQDLVRFLEGCHRLSTKIRAVTELSAGTTGVTTNPTHRLFPQQILPWHDFPPRQHEFWSRSATSESLWNERVYDSATNLDYIERLIDPIGSEDDLRYIERLTLENMVRNVLNHISTDGVVNGDWRSYGKISFENQAAFRAEQNRTLSSAMQDLRVDDDYPQRPRNTRADQFCVVRNEDGVARPIVAIEYKAPHKLTIEGICIGLKSEIWPERDVIDKIDDDVGFLYKNLMAAVITQLFSYMIDKGVRYGYICTGEAFVFLRIPDDPTKVYYSINIPSRDYKNEDDNRLERTAVSQVVAFIHQALQDEQPDQLWIQAARSKLKRWKVEFIDVLAKIPETVRKTRDASVYQPSPWVQSTRRSPIRLRSRCESPSLAPRQDEDDSGSDDGDEGTQSPTQGMQTRSRAAAARAVRNREQRGEREDHGKRQHRGHRDHGREGENRIAIEKRPYCTHQCLRGLCTGQPLDQLCPNAALHGQNHLKRSAFLQLLSEQLARDRGQDADCCALYIHGARGALLKVCLTSHGYTLVAKGYEARCRKHVLNEAQIYERLEPAQGRYVPVFCGLIDLDVPYHYDGVELRHLLLMSWAGRSLNALARDDPDPQLRKRCIDLASTALEAVHSLQVLHCDAVPRNIMYDDLTGTVVILDFERSEQYVDEPPRQVLGALSPNRKSKKVKVDDKDVSQDKFKKELRALRYHVEKALSF